MRAGSSLVELVVALAVMAILLAIGAPHVGSTRDGAAVSSAASAVMAELALARHAAIARGRRVAVLFDGPHALVTVAMDGDTLARRRLDAKLGVALAVTRDSIAYGPTGLGYGAANTRLILHRGRSADTITVSRLGRVRRW